MPGIANRRTARRLVWRLSLTAMPGGDALTANWRREIESLWRSFHCAFVQHEAGEVNLLQFTFTEDPRTRD